MNMPKTQLQLLALLTPAETFVPVPRKLQGAARGLWGHRDGHMVSLGHPAPGVVTARLTGRGRDLVAAQAPG